MQAQLSSGAICLGFDLKFIYFHALIVKKIIINVNVKKMDLSLTSVQKL